MPYIVYSFKFSNAPTRRAVYKRDGNSTASVGERQIYEKRRRD